MPFPINGGGVKKIAEVEANASTIVLEGLDKTKAYIMFVVFRNADTAYKRYLHIRVNGDTGTNYRFQIHAVTKDTAEMANQPYGTATLITLGKAPASGGELAVVHVSPEWYDPSTSRYTISFRAVGGGYGPTTFYGAGDYGLSTPIPSPYKIEVGNVNGYFSYVKVVLFEVVG